MLFGGIYNDVHRCLSRDGRAEANRQQFDELGLHLWIHVQHLHVAAAETTPEWEMETKHRYYEMVLYTSGVPIHVQYLFKNIWFGTPCETDNFIVYVNEKPQLEGAIHFHILGVIQVPSPLQQHYTLTGGLDKNCAQHLLSCA